MQIEEERRTNRGYEARSLTSRRPHTNFFLRITLLCGVGAESITYKMFRLINKSQSFNN